MSSNDLQRLIKNRKAIPNKTYAEDPDKNGRINYYIGNNDGKLRIISKQEYDSIVNPVTPVVNNVTNITGTTFVAGGDLSGTATNQTVQKILNNTVPVDAVGALTNDGAGNLSWTPGGAGYITSILDTATIDLNVALGVLTANFINAAGYITGAQVPANETDPVFTAWLTVPPNVSIFTNDVPYLTSASLSGYVTGTGTINEIAYFTGASAIASLAVATYPSLTELSYLKGVTSALQTQLNNKQPLSANLTSASGLAYVSTSFVKMTGANTFALDTNTYLTSVTGHNLLSATHPDTVAASPVRGDIIVGNTTPAWTKLALGTVGKILRSDGSDLVYTTFTIPDTYATGDTLYASAANTLSKLGVGSNGQVLTLAAGIPSWATPTTGLTTLTVGTTTITSGATTRILYDNAGVLGEYTITGTGTVVAMQTSPTFATSITGSYLTASEILITDGSKNIVSAPVATYPSLTELSYVKGVTSAIQTQINTKQATISLTTTGTSGAATFAANTLNIPIYSTGTAIVLDKTVTDVSLTGTTAETKVYSYSIAAGTLASGDIVDLLARFRKTGTAGTMITRIRFGTNNSTADTIMATMTSATSTLTQNMERTYLIKDSTHIEVYPPTSNVNTDVASSGTAVTSVTVNLGVTNYLTVSIQNASAADTSYFSGWYLRKN